MLRTALRNVLAHKARLLMTVLAVLLGVAFVSGTLVFTSTISNAFKKSSEKGYSGVDLAIRPGASSGQSQAGPAAGARAGGKGADDAPQLTEKTLAKARALPGAAHATGTVSGFAALADKHGELVGKGWQTSGANYDAGRNGKGHDSRYPMSHGHAPKMSGEIAIDSKTAARTGYKVGDTARLSVDGPVRKERIAGIYHTNDGNVAAGGTLVLFDTHTAQQLLTSPGTYDQIRLTAAHGTSQGTLKSEAAKILPHGTEAVTGKKLAADQSDQIEKSMSGMQTAMLVFAGISLFVGIFIIANTFTMLVAQRTKELALMRAVGASRRQVTRSVLAEAFVVGTIAAVAGLAAGVGIGAALRSLMGRFGGGSVPDGPLIVSGTAVAASLITGIVVTVLAAWLPARRAAKVPPVAAMTSVHAAATTRSLVVRNTIGALIAGAGAALVLHASGMKSADDGKLPMGAGAALLLVGVFVLTPLLSRPLIALASPFMRIFGVSGKLARQNSVRNPRRTAATASALMIGLTLITGMTVIAGSVQQAVDSMAVKALKADYTVSMANHSPLSPKVEHNLAGDKRVQALSPLRQSPARIDGKPDSLTGVAGKDVGKLTDLPFSAGGWHGLAHEPAPKPQKQHKPRAPQQQPGAGQQSQKGTQQGGQAGGGAAAQKAAQQKAAQQKAAAEQQAKGGQAKGGQAAGAQQAAPPVKPPHAETRLAVVDKDTAKSQHLKLGSKLPVTYEDGAKGKLKVSGIYKGNQLIHGVMVDTSTLKPHTRQVTDMQVMVKTQGGASSSAKQSLVKAMGDNPALLIQDKQDLTDQLAKVFTLMLNMLYGLLAMAVIVAVLGVVNTLAMSVFERSQEIGMLRAIGLDRRGIKRMVRLESLVIALFGGVLGIGLGVFFGWAAGKLIKPSLSEYQLILPWDRMGVFLALAAVVGVLAALWPARRAARLNMLDAIKSE